MCGFVIVCLILSLFVWFCHCLFDFVIVFVDTFRSFVVLDTLFVLMDVSLLWYTAISSILLTICFNIMSFLHNIHQTTVSTSF